MLLPAKEPRVSTSLKYRALEPILAASPTVPAAMPNDHPEATLTEFAHQAG